MSIRVRELYTCVWPRAAIIVEKKPKNGLAALRASLSCLQNKSSERVGGNRENPRERQRVRQRECRWFSQAQVWVRVRVRVRQPLTTTRISCVTFNVNMHNYVRVFVCLPLALTRPLVAKTKITQNKRGTTQHTQTCYIFLCIMKTV